MVSSTESPLDSSIAKQIPRNLKLLFLIHAIAAVIFGLPLVLIPETWGTLVDWHTVDPTMTRGLGAALIAVGFLSYLGYRATYWETVRLVVAFEIAFPALLALLGLVELLFAGAPVFHWVNVVITAAFAIAFAYFYRQLMNQAPVS